MNKFFYNIFALILIVPFFLAGCNSQNSTPSDTNYTISVTTNNSTYGSVYGDGVYSKDEQVIICAIANYGCEFVSWNDGNTDAVRKITVSQDKSYSATFQLKNSTSKDINYTISVTTNNSTYGSVYGGGVYSNDEQVIICAVANDGYEFVSWNDDNTDAVRKITVSQDKSYSATFQAKSETKYYALDKVEIYVEKLDSITAKCVRIDRVKIYNGTQKISGFGNDYYTSFDDGCILLDYAEVNNTYNVHATATWPLYFYSTNSQYNKFEKGSAATLTVSVDLQCSVDYSADDNSHGGTLVNSLNITTPAINEETSSTHLIYTDDKNHGYKVYMRLNFVEL